MPKEKKTGALSGFLSYSHKNNNLGLIAEIHKLLCGSLEQLFDERFEIYYDNDDKNKEQGRLTDTIKSRIDDSNVFIPVISTSYCKAQGTAYHEFMYAQTRVGGESQLLIAPLILGEISRDIENSVIWRHVRELMTFRLGNVLAAHDAAQFTPTITTFAYTLHKKLFTDRVAPTTKVALRDIRDLMKDIEAAAHESTAHNAFRGQLIHNILEDVVGHRSLVFCSTGANPTSLFLQDRIVTINRPSCSSP